MAKKKAVKKATHAKAAPKKAAPKKATQGKATHPKATPAKATPKTAAPPAKPAAPPVKAGAAPGAPVKAPRVKKPSGPAPGEIAFPPYAGALRYAEPLAKHTTFRIGGPAKIHFTPATPEAAGE